MKFKHVFIAVFVTAGIVGGALLIAHERPPAETEQPSADLVKATGKCAECHAKETSAVVHQFERSAHARADVTCLDCHGPAENQTSTSHRGFEISEDLTSANCAKCHAEQHKQFMRSRHAAPAWAAVKGAEDFTEEQIEHAEKYHEGTVKRPANKLAQLEGQGAIEKGCGSCHAIGKPNPDGSIGSCTECHSRHNTSIELARSPETCGQCHMGPDHSQLEIFKESKHGALFTVQRDSMNMDADPKKLTTEDMPVPTCATCHMSGLEGMKVTHDVGERLGWYLFADVSEKRPNFQAGTDEMQAVCTKCHTQGHVDTFYADAEKVLHSTNDKVMRVRKTMDGLYEDGVLTKEPFDEPIEFVYFDLWHYYGRTAKHGAYMGGADFVQWHGNYELLLHEVEINEMAEELREKKGHGDAHKNGSEEGESDE